MKNSRCRFYWAASRYYIEK